MSPDRNCIFCKIAAGEIPAAVVFQNDTIVAFLDIGPLAEGHLLVIPRSHHEGLTDLPGTTAAALAAEIPRLGKALLVVTEAEGFNLLVNQGRAAGQEVPHVHFHLIPRRKQDGLGYRWCPGSYRDDRAQQLKDAYRAALTGEA